MTLTIIGTLATTFFLLVGAIFTMVGAIGLLKLNDSMSRLHAPTKVGTLGIGALLLASIVHSFTFADGSMDELLIIAFLFVTAPISANFMSKVNIHKRDCETPPGPPLDDTWSTLNAPDDPIAPQTDAST